MSGPTPVAASLPPRLLSMLLRLGRVWGGSLLCCTVVTATTAIDAGSRYSFAGFRQSLQTQLEQNSGNAVDIAVPKRLMRVEKSAPAKPHQALHPQLHDSGTDDDVLLRRKLTLAKVPSETGVFMHSDGDSEFCGDCREVYYDMTEHGDAWALVMKLSGNQFCFNSSKWVTEDNFNHHKLWSQRTPGQKEYDAKGLAFHKLQTRELKFESHRGDTVSVKFKFGASPAELITTESVPFAEYPDFEAWKQVFDPEGSFSKGSVFMRNGQVVLDPGPPCRDGNYEMQGCSGPCTFCFLASKGTGCPGIGGPDDITIGIGNSPESCRSSADGCRSPEGQNDESCKSNLESCSSALSDDDDPNRILVWALVTKDQLQAYDQ